MKLGVNRKRGQRAFTLMEVMLALAILAVIVSGIYTAWHSIIKAKQVADAAAASAQRTRIAMHTLHDAFLCACMFNENAKYYSFEADSEGDFATISFAARLPKSFPRSGYFGDYDVRRLTFSVEPGSTPDNKNQLVLRQSPILMDTTQEEVDNPLVLAKNVDKFLIEFWDQQQGDYVTTWTSTNTLPQLVRFSLALGKLNQFSSQSQEAMVDTVALPAQAVRVEWQMPVLGGRASAGGPTTGNGNHPGNQPPGAKK